MGIFNRAKRVAILGCGPSGMFAAHAFEEAGWDTTIYSRKRKSHMFGAQYLHSPIPGLPEYRTDINYVLDGTVEGYRDKVYGPPAPGRERVQTSPETLVGLHPAWDIRAAYDAAWQKYEHLVVNANIDPPWIVGEFGNPESKKYWKAVVSTIPAHRLCNKPETHQFIKQSVWASGDAPELGRWCPVRVQANTVICNGDPERAWYRAANVFGHSTAEWPYDRKPPVSNLAEVVKPLSTNCDCFPEITRMGRYGAWQKGYLTDEVYVRAAKIAAKG